VCLVRYLCHFLSRGQFGACDHGPADVNEVVLAQKELFSKFLNADFTDRMNKKSVYCMEF